MSFLRQSTDQARDAFTAMPMQSRIISVMLVAAIAIGLGFLVRGNGKASTEYLFGGRLLGEQELFTVELAFGNAALNGWEREGRRIKIPRDSRSDYLAALETSAALPMSLRTMVQDAIDKTGVFDSNELRRAREMHAKEQDLGTKIMAFPDVRAASVEYDRGERTGLSRTTPQSASVVVHPEGSDALSNYRIKQIQELVRSSYAAMTSEDVAVIDTNATSAYGSSDEDDPLLRKQHEAEARVEQKVRSLLIGYPVRVAASAEIDPTMDVEKTTVKYDAEPTNLMTKSRKIESQSNRPANRGVPGASPNGIGNRAISIEDDLEMTKNKEDERESSGVAGQQYENSRMASLQVKRIRVSVGLPNSYYATVHGQTFLQENPGKTAVDVPRMDETTLEKLREDTKKNIQGAITVLLPEVSAGEDRYPLVEVWDYPDLPSPLPPEPETARQAMTWLAESWQTIALVFLAFVALLVARSAARGGSGDSTPGDFAEGFGLNIPTPPPELVDQDDDSEQMTITGGSLKEELSVLVENNPEVAANVIRGWVGEAA